jgi:hypothetical protein
LPDTPDHSGDITNLQNFQTMINSMLSETHAFYYVDSVNGSDTNDGSLNKPFKSINKAISTANKRRFIGSSQCYIRILNDITLTLDTNDTIVEQSTQQSIVFYHPDLVQTKYFTVQGWDGINKTLKNRKINFTHPSSKLYVCVFKTHTNLHSQNLEFDGGVNEDVINGYNNKSTCAILKAENSTIDVLINECTFSNLNVALARPTYVCGCRFNNVGTCIIGNLVSQTKIDSSIARNCDVFCRCDTQSFVRIAKESKNYPLDIESRHIFMLTSGANIIFDYVNSSFISYNMWDTDRNHSNILKRNPNSNYENVYLRIEKLYKDSSGNKVKRNIIGDCDYENPSANIGDANYMTLKNKPSIN